MDEDKVYNAMLLFCSALLLLSGVIQSQDLGSITQSNWTRKFTLANVSHLVSSSFDLACSSPYTLAKLDSREMQNHLVAEANRTQCRHVTAWVSLDRALTRHDSLVYINGSVVTDDVTDSNSSELVCASLYIKARGVAVVQIEACGRQHLYICRTENTSADATCINEDCYKVHSYPSTWFEARHHCRTEASSRDLAFPGAALLSFLAFSPGARDETYWIAAASEDSLAAYWVWLPGQDTPSYDCVLLNLTTGQWTAVSCDQTNDFVLCEYATTVIAATEQYTSSLTTNTTPDGADLSSSTTTQASGNTHNSAAIAGIVVACVVVVAIAIIIAVVCARCEKTSVKSSDEGLPSSWLAADHHGLSLERAATRGVQSGQSLDMEGATRDQNSTLK